MTLKLSDTEVLLKSYLHWGEKCQLKLDGMWAFAIGMIKKHFSYQEIDLEKNLYFT